MTAAPWQRELQAAIRDPGELLTRLDLDPALEAPAREAARLFPLRVPVAYLDRIRPGDPSDPLLRQVLPIGLESTHSDGYTADPVGDGLSLHHGGVIHKYHGRALLVATGTCAINCRYCFRRHFPYAEANASAAEWQQAVNYLSANPGIQEVILSGGDPLSLNDRRLQGLSGQLDAIPHLRRLRIHSRLPVVLPGRVDDDLLGWLQNQRLTPVLVIHANHPNELDETVARAMQALSRCGVRLYNQTVLLRGVNDDASVLKALSERLFEINVQPYYLHLLDRVQGAAHFDLPVDRACALMRELAASVPGYLLPTLVREVAGAPWKVPIPWAGPAD